MKKNFFLKRTEWENRRECTSLVHTVCQALWCFTNSKLSNPLTNPGKLGLFLSPFYRWGSGSSLSRVRQMRSRVRIWIQACLASESALLNTRLCCLSLQMILFSIRIMTRTFPFSSACFLCCGLLPLPGFSPALSSPQKCISRGELQVSLSYQPVAQRMTVVVLKARHLPKMDITGLSGSSYLLQPISFFSFFLPLF